MRLPPPPKTLAAPCFFPCLPDTGCKGCYPPPPPSERATQPRSPRTRVRRHTRNKIGDRDGWTCGYCHTHVDRDLRWPHPLSPSTGHIRWVGFGAGGTDDPANLRIEHLACNMQNVPPVLALLGLRARVQREGGLPPYTEEQRRIIVAEALHNAPPTLPRDEAVRRYWRPGMVSWDRWHTENPGACGCTPEAANSFCLRAAPDTAATEL